MSALTGTLTIGIEDGRVLLHIEAADGTWIRQTLSAEDAQRIAARLQDAAGRCAPRPAPTGFVRIPVEVKRG